mmetsp:Transcript_50160/g.150993  ORF Transcript_50160/g.150993 Transcript_50160/m.150993 type:complete len:624 (-) Transcript_50160:56-1927(-)
MSSLKRKHPYNTRFSFRKRNATGQGERVNIVGHYKPAQCRSLPQEEHDVLVDSKSAQCGSQDEQINVLADSKPARCQSLPRAAKPLKGGYSIASFESLCDDIIHLIYEMLGSAKDLFRLSLSSKHLLSLVTPEDVIRASIFQGGHAQKTITEVTAAVQRRTIYVPSAMRLLRLANGKKCERLEKCKGFNAKRGMPRLVNTIRPNSGLFLCTQCVKSMTCKVDDEDFDHDFALEEERLATVSIDYSRRLFNKPHFEHATGERCGPILTMKELTNVYEDFDTEEERWEGLKDFLKEHDEDYDEDVSLANKISCEHERAKSESFAFHEKQMVRYKARYDIRNSRREKRLRSIHAKLDNLLQDAPWKTLALACSWNGGSPWPLHFSCQLTRDMTSDLVSNSSSATERKIHGAAACIRETFNLLYEKEFFNLDFLQCSHHPMERAIRCYCKDNMSTADILRVIDMKSLELIRQNRLADALVRVLWFGDTFRKCFISAVVPDDFSLLEHDNHRRLADQVWVSHSSWANSRWHFGDRSTQALQDHYLECLETYMELRAASASYLANPATVNFIGQDPDPNFDDEMFSREDAVDSVWDDPSSHSLLLEGSFDDLLALHERYYRSPWLYADD